MVMGGLMEGMKNREPAGREGEGYDRASGLDGFGDPAQ